MSNTPERNELRATVAAGISALTPKQGAAIRLWMDGHSHREIAERVGTTEAASWALIARAKRQLVKKF